MQVDVFIHAQWNKYSKEFSYSVFNCDMTEYGYVLVSQQSAEFESPAEKNLRIAASKSLRVKQAAGRAKAWAEDQQIEQEITELLAIEDKSQEVVAEVVSEEDNDLPF